MPDATRQVLHPFSKSKYLAGLQCRKRLYLDIHSPELAEEVGARTQESLDWGTEVGILARRCFPGGMLVEWAGGRTAQALRRTADLMNDPDIAAIFEGAFAYNGVCVRCDILARGQAGRWKLIEVKSATSVKDEHYDDLAIQYYVLKGCGVNLSKAFIMHVNASYVHQGGDVDVAEFFTLADVTAEVSARQRSIHGTLAELRTMLAAPSAPAIEPGYHCGSPYDCRFWSYCTKEKPERWIYYLPGLREKRFQELVALGIERIDEIPADFALSVRQRHVKDGVEWIGKGLQKELRRLRYPIHHLDFETMYLPIPRYVHTRPYQQIPFQWSDHIEEADGSIRHLDYLCTECQDPRDKWAVTLLQALGENGSICVYSGFERRILTEVADHLPALKRNIERAIARLWDLYAVLKAQYFHPDFDGSYSLKYVLPALVPSLHYGDLEIQDGGMANSSYYRMIFGDVEAGERTRIAEALRQYCGRDTLGMVEVRRNLIQKTKFSKIDHCSISSKMRHMLNAWMYL